MFSITFDKLDPISVTDSAALCYNLRNNFVQSFHVSINMRFTYFCQPMSWIEKIMRRMSKSKINYFNNLIVYFCHAGIFINLRMHNFKAPTYINIRRRHSSASITRVFKQCACMCKIIIISFSLGPEMKCNHQLQEPSFMNYRKRFIRKQLIEFLSETEQLVATFSLSL